MPHLVLGSVAYSVTKPNFDVILPPPVVSIEASDPALATEAHLNDFISKLQGMQIVFTATTYAAMCNELRTKVRNRIFGPGATHPLGPGNKIIDVYVNDSRESGDSDMWRSATGSNFAIHPMTNANSAQGPINIGVAPHPNPQTAQYWLLADVVAYGP